MVLAALDLGSNSFHVLVARGNANGTLTKLGSRKETLRLGAAVRAEGRIPDDLFRRAVAAATGLVDYARSLGAARVTVVGTSALRDARNGGMLSHALLLRAGVRVELLSGETEGRLVYLGARHALPELEGPIGVVDIGGGSVEIALGDGARCLDVESLPLGFLRFPRAPGVGGELDADALARHVATVAGPFAARVRALSPRTWLFTGGTARAFAGAARGLLPLVRDRLERAEVRAVARELVAADAARLAAFGVDAARRDVIGTGAFLVERLAALFDASTLRVAPGGLREGVILRELAAAPSAALPAPARPRAGFAAARPELTR